MGNRKNHVIRITIHLHHICTKLDLSTKGVRCGTICHRPSRPNKHEKWYWLLKDGCETIRYGRHILELHLASKLSRTDYLQNMDRTCASRYSSVGLYEPNPKPMPLLVFLCCCHHAYGRKSQL